MFRTKNFNDKFVGIEGRVEKLSAGTSHSLALTDAGQVDIVCDNIVVYPCLNPWLYACVSWKSNKTNSRQVILDKS